MKKKKILRLPFRIICGLLSLYTLHTAILMALFYQSHELIALVTILPLSIFMTILSIWLTFMKEKEIDSETIHPD